jgi:hypothetical protein
LAATVIDVSDSGHFSVFTQLEFLKYDFDIDLRLVSPVVSHGYQRAYADALASGAKLPPLDIEKTTAQLAAGIRYYDGAKKAWVNGWARSNPR